MPIEFESQRAHLRSCISEEMRLHIKCALEIGKEANLTIVEILDDIQTHLRQTKFIALDRVSFVERRQEENEDFDSFFVAIKKLSIEADLCKTCVQKLLAITPFPDLQIVKLKILIFWRRIK